MIYIPENIKKIIDNEDYKTDGIGMSDSTVLLLKDKILKIQTVSEEADNEYRMMKWLNKKLPVPVPLCFEKQEGKSYLLMSRVRGQMSCEEPYMKNHKQLASILAEGLLMLWQTDITGCPSSWSLDKKLKTAKYNVENKLVDLDNAEPDTFGKNRFKDPAHLLEWLENNRPKEEYVISHGDYCLPNVFINNGRISGFIDLGKTGLADKWQDIALCLRSLRHNYEGKYSGISYGDFWPDCLFEKLGMEPDWKKIEYYILLDELF